MLGCRCVFMNVITYFMCFVGGGGSAGTLAAPSGRTTKARQSQREGSRNEESSVSGGPWCGLGGLSWRRLDESASRFVGFLRVSCVTSTKSRMFVVTAVFCFLRQTCWLGGSTWCTRRYRCCCVGFPYPASRLWSAVRVCCCVGLL